MFPAGEEAGIMANNGGGGGRGRCGRRAPGEEDRELLDQGAERLVGLGGSGIRAAVGEEVAVDVTELWRQVGQHAGGLKEPKLGVTQEEQEEDGQDHHKDGGRGAGCE